MLLTKTQKQKTVLYLLISLAFITLVVLPATFFDQGKSICVSVLLLDRECYGCGMTRAFQHIIHLDFETAWHYNKMSFIAFPLLAFIILQDVKLSYWTKLKQNEEV